MKELQLSEIHQIEIQLLRHFDEFCRKNEIRYYLSNGTLLGAIKYKGFIPWDDDIDVLVPRKDFKKIMEIYPSDSPYCLLHSDRCSKYPLPFAKLCDRKTEIENGLLLEGKRIGVHIDIFPLDYLPKNKIKRICLLKKRQYLISMLGFAMSSFSPSKTLFRTLLKYILMMIAKVLGVQVFIKLLELDQIGNRNDISNEYEGCAVWPVYGKNESIPSSNFSEVVYVEFEKETFPAPIGFEKYLHSLYGDYTLDPPLEKQKSHHRFIAYKKCNINVV